jgi:hypothetical protein
MLRRDTPAGDLCELVSAFLIVFYAVMLLLLLWAC